MRQELLIKAYRLWYRHYCEESNSFVIDKRVVPFLNEKISSQSTGWLKQVREALLLSTGDCAKRAGTQRSTWVKFERNESLGVIQLNTLRKLAEAMDCEFVYAIRSKKRLCFSEVIWERLIETAVDHPWVRSRPCHLKDRALAAVAKNIMRGKTSG